MRVRRTNIVVLVLVVLAITLYSLCAGAPSPPSSTVAETFFRTMVRNTQFPSLETRLKFGSSDVWREVPGVTRENNASSEVLHPIADRTFYMLKTGADVMWERLPVHLETTLKRFPHHQIYSDAPGQIGNEKVIDIIEDIAASLQSEQLNAYREIRRQYDLAWGWKAGDLKKDASNAGWDTDKFKNIPMIYHAWKNAPKTCDWFVFADDDTYIHSDSLGSLLADLNPKDKHYVGSNALIDNGFALSGKVWEKRIKEAKEGEEPLGLVFAHGGSGVAVSRGTLDALFWDTQREVDTVNKYSELATRICCGDAMFAWMLREELELDINTAFKREELKPDPFFGEGVGETKVYVGKKEGECQRLVSWHHLDPENIQRLFDWERSVSSRKPEGGVSVLYSDAYADFVLPFVQPERDYWRVKAHADGYRGPANIFWVDDTTMLKLSDDYKKAIEDSHLAPAASAGDCKYACELHPECLTYMYEEPQGDEMSLCTLEHTVIMRGTNTHPFLGTDNSKKRVVSGYVVDRIRKLRAKEKCDWLEYDESTRTFSDNETEREGWYFRELSKEQGGITDQPVYGK